MSTPTDREKLREHLERLNLRDRPKSALIVGAYDRFDVMLVRQCFELSRCKTLDKDASLKPSIICDLDELFDLVERFDVAVVSYVLMYLKDPLKTLMRLGKWCKTVVIQENVIRNRPNNDPWPDLNRFICDNATAELMVQSAQDAKSCGRRLVRFPLLWSFSEEPTYYENPPGVSAIWQMKA